MCGIVAYKGYKDCYPILLNGLKRLEYRGYDSAGIASINSENKLVVTKRRGKVSELELALSKTDIYNSGMVAEFCIYSENPYKKVFKYTMICIITVINGIILKFMYKLKI